MKIWEAIQMLEQMDQNKEVIVTFGTAIKASKSQESKHSFVVGNEFWKIQDEKGGRFVPQQTIWPQSGYNVTCNAH